MTAAGTGLMPIGAFARLCRLTVKAVRHYDAEGLLVPAEVEPHSGYRYYRAEQVRTATTSRCCAASTCRFPWCATCSPPPGPAAVAGVLAAQRERWATELARREQVLRSLDVLPYRPERVRYDVADRAGVRLAGVEGVVRAGHLDFDVGALCLRAMRTAPRGEPLVAVFPVDLADTMPVTVAVAVAGPGRAVSSRGSHGAARRAVGRDAARGPVR